MNKLILRLAKSILRKKLGSNDYAKEFLDFSNIAAEGFCYGNDELIEQAESRLIKRLGPHLESEQFILDIGANVGTYASKWLEYTNNIIAFEPGKVAFNSLNQKYKDKIKVENIAIGEEEGELALFTESKDSKLNSLYPRKNKNHNWANFAKVKVDTLDNYCKANKIESIYFLKIDVEGHELEVLKGASSTLLKLKYIQFEFGGAHLDSGHHFREFFDLLSPHFQLNFILKDGLYPIKEYHEKLENFRGNNFLAVAKNTTFL